jgi:hypothetical protein
MDYPPGSRNARLTVVNLPLLPFSFRPASRRESPLVPGSLGPARRIAPQLAARELPW